MSVARNRPKELDGKYALRGSYRMAVSTGAVTTIAAGTASAGHLFSFRWADSTAARCIVRYVGAKFILTTAFGAAQEVGIDMVLARSYSASHTGATAVDCGDTVASSNKMMADFATSLMATSGLCRIAGAGALTAGTHTFDANKVGTLSDWASGIGVTIPTTSSGIGGTYGTLFDGFGPDSSGLVLKQNEGFVLRNTVLMGATGVGRWDFLIVWDEGVPE